MDAIGMTIAIDVTRHYALSARPDAPVVPDNTPGGGHRQRGPGLVRRVAASGLRRLADQLEPCQAVAPS